MDTHANVCSDEGHGMGVRQRNVCSHEDLQPLISPNTSVGCVCEGSTTKVAKRDGRVFGHRTGGRQLLERRGISGSVWSWGGVLLVLGAILTATDVAGQTPKLLENNGGHFRFGNIRWEKLEGNKVQFTIESAWRRDYSSAYWKGLGDDGLTVVGDVIHLNGRQWPVFNYGDDSVTAGEYLKLQVMAYSKTENWVFGESVITHTYATPNNKGAPWLASFTGCCKLSEINNEQHKDAPWLLQTSIDLLKLTKSPRITAMPVYSLPDPPILPTPAAPDASDIPKVPVSFYVPAFHPDGSDPTATTLASLVTPVTDLGVPPVTGQPVQGVKFSQARDGRDSVTPIIAQATADGKVTLNFYGLDVFGGVEFAGTQKDNGPFFFLKVNGTSVSTGLFVQADFLIRVLRRPDFLMPKIAFGHSTLKNLAGPPTINGSTGGLVEAQADGYVSGSTAVKFWPEASYLAFLGFEVNFTVVAQDPNLDQRIGFTAVGLPSYARVTTVKGTNPVQIRTYWVPCQGQVGRHVMCYEAVDSAGNASTPECVNVKVEADPAPQFAPATDSDGDRFRAKYQTRTVDMDQIVLVTMGALKTYTVHAYDLNCLDQVDIGIAGVLPPGAVFAPQQQAPSPVTCGSAQVWQAGGPSEKQSMSRTLEWAAPPHYGGNVTSICFTATDAAGSCGGAGKADVTVKCVTFRVLRCKYSVGGEHQLAEVARLFDSDWLQIWKQNPSIVHPDYILFSGQALDIGRLYTVAASDNLYAIAKRFGTPLEMLYKLNNDLQGKAFIQEGSELCVIPNSCKGQDESVYEGVAELRVYQCKGQVSNAGAVYPSLQACRASCSLTGGTCSSVSTVT